jgi:hypothetical protein
MMEPDRRAARRHPVEIYFNKYIDGVPHACETIELSSTGVLARRLLGPEVSLACYAVEIGDVGGTERLWLCATPVWQDGDIEALGFVGHSDTDRARLEALLTKVAA